MLMCNVLQFWSNYWVSKMFSRGLKFFLTKHIFKKIRLNFTIFLVPHHKMQVRFIPKKIWWEIIMFLKLFLEFKLKSFEYILSNLLELSQVKICNGLQNAGLRTTKCWSTWTKIPENIFTSVNITDNITAGFATIELITTNKEYNGFQCSSCEKSKTSSIFRAFFV